MASSSLISPVVVHEEFVLRKCDCFVDMQLWPRRSRLDPERWLRNFTSDERDHAVQLLNAFVYYSSELVKELFRGAFQSLSIDIVPTDAPFIQADASWKSFRRTVLVTRVVGERPSDTDSGFIFERLARQELEIPQENILSPQKTLEFLLSHGSRPVVFVDDFVGSGRQFISTWSRDFTLRDGTTLSFESYSAIRANRFFYCPLLCTAAGHRAVTDKCRPVRLRPAHLLDERYSVLGSESLVWPEQFRPTAEAFVLDASVRAGIAPEAAFGYKRLGLCLAFEHCVPDATIPLFHHNANGWFPLVRRS